jgi:uncharacterized protein YbjT (DUF2867 family)
MSNETFVVTGATGNIGSHLAETLLKNGHNVRVIGRSKERLQQFVDQGAKATVGDLADPQFLTESFRGAKAVFAMIPPSFAAQDFRKYQGGISDSLVRAIRDSGVKQVVALSSLGAYQPEGTGPITGLYDFEQKLNGLDGVNVLMLRPTFFMENLYDGIPAIRNMGVNGSGIRPDIAFPMIATRDIAAVAAEAMENSRFSGKQVRDLLGPRDVSMNEATRVIGKAIGKEDLQYVQFPLEAVKQAMLGMGASESLANDITEMTQWLNASEGQFNLVRNQENTTPTTIEEFASDFAAAYEAGKAHSA